MDLVIYYREATFNHKVDDLENYINDFLIVDTPHDDNENTLLEIYSQELSELSIRFKNQI